MSSSSVSQSSLRKNVETGELKGNHPRRTVSTVVETRENETVEGSQYVKIGVV